MNPPAAVTGECPYRVRIILAALSKVIAQETLIRFDPFIKYFQFCALMKASFLTRSNSYFHSIFLLMCNYFILKVYFSWIDFPSLLLLIIPEASHWNVFSSTSRNRGRWSQCCEWVLLLVYNKTVIFIWQLLITYAIKKEESIHSSYPCLEWQFSFFTPWH